ncbi:MAG: hypothetical protein WCY99_07100, partial [Candidatus Neomarinimicrobiota bacterium]
MPGLSICFKNDPGEFPALDPDLLNAEAYYRTETIFNDAHIRILSAHYPGYPVEHFETPDFFICLEGLIYNKSALEYRAELLELASSDPGKISGGIFDFIEAFHGDYIAYLYDRNKNALCVFNDRWGRLKTQYYYDKDIMLVSRDHLFILENLPAIAFDKKAILEFIMFRFYLEGKTILSGVMRTGPSAVLWAARTERDLSVRIEKKECDLTTAAAFPGKKHFIEKYTDMYLQSLRDIVKTLRERQLKIIGDLSGGLDSRAVFYGICKVTKDSEFFTDELISGDESPYALKVADQCGMKLTKVRAEHPMDIGEMSQITLQTGCTINAITNLACYYDSAERKTMVPEPAAKFQGFGGEFLRHPYRFITGYGSMTSMFKDDFIISGIPMRSASALLGLDHSGVADHFTQIEGNYPEKKVRDKIKHFYFDYYSGLVYQGEDRGRMHFWTVQPLMSHDVLSCALQELPRNKINTELFIRFLKRLDARSLNTPLFRYKFKPNSAAGMKLHTLREHLDTFFRYTKPLRLISRKLNRLVEKKN